MRAMGEGDFSLKGPGEREDDMFDVVHQICHINTRTFDVMYCEVRTSLCLLELVA